MNVDIEFIQQITTYTGIYTVQGDIVSNTSTLNYTQVIVHRFHKKHNILGC